KQTSKARVFVGVMEWLTCGFELFSSAYLLFLTAVVTPYHFCETTVVLTCQSRASDQATPTTSCQRANHTLKRVLQAKNDPNFESAAKPRPLGGTNFIVTQ
ncbi:hypothetical protein M9458_017659, partial [Cirrhinus mrigala]